MKNIIKKMMNIIDNNSRNNNFHYKEGDLFLAHAIKKCDNIDHHFPLVATINGIRVDDVSSCQCKKYKNNKIYYMEVDAIICSNVKIK